jgi:hypothetical protein
METSTSTPSTPEFKKCPSCKGDFWLSEFEPLTSQGYLQAYCKECRAIKRLSAKPKRTREEYNAYMREYMKTYTPGKRGRLLSDL